MLFEQQQFLPERVPNPEVRETIQAVFKQKSEPAAVGLWLFELLRRNPPALSSIMQAVSQVDHLEEAATQTWHSLPDANTEPRPITEQHFTSQALQTLHDWEHNLQDQEGVLTPVALEVFAHLCCHHVEPTYRTVLDPLVDIHQMEQLLRQKIVAYLQQQTQEEDSEDSSAEFSLDELVVSWEDLTLQAQESHIEGPLPFEGEPVFETLFDDLARILHRRRCNHILLCGERGVGKSTLVAELARRAAKGSIPILSERRFISLDCRYVPPEESRQYLVAILQPLIPQQELIVCIEGLASLLRSGQGGTHRAILLSALSRSRCQLIGLLTPREFEELFSDDPDLFDFFDPVEVIEPDEEVALKLLHHYAKGLEQKFDLTLDEEAVRQSVLLSSSYILHDQLPAKALKILHRVCEDVDYDRQQDASTEKHVTVERVIDTVAHLSGVPEETLRGISDRTDYVQSLKQHIFGQDHAVQAVAQELGLIKAGMTESDKPASVMLFLGQTGTGKTEMAKVLARFYSTSKKLKTYTLGNCVEPHSVSTIIGVPPGYVGTDQGGRLINELNADPYCVFLLDEVDKAHPDVLQPFLNLFDEGWVSDQRGVKAYANKSIFILTSNVGQRMIADMVQQGKSRAEITERMKEALSQIRHTKSERPVFTPEFLARLKRIIVFHPLDEQSMEHITRRMLSDLQKDWNSKRGKRLEVAEELIEVLGKRGHQLNEKSKGKEGGRIIRKLIAEYLESNVQKRIAEEPEQYKRSCGMQLSLAGKPPSLDSESEFQLDVVVTFLSQAVEQSESEAGA